jgi:hypothetical protein
MLGAIVGAGVLAAVGAVGAATGGSTRPAYRAESSPKAALQDLAFIDSQLTKAINEAKEGKDVASRIDNIVRAKLQLVRGVLTAPVDGVAGSIWFRTLDCVDVDVKLAKITEQGHAFIHAPRKNTVPQFLEAAAGCKKRLEADVQKANPPPRAEKLSLTTFPTWTHNTDIGKSNICINVKTEPAQGFLSATLTGPGGFHTSLPKTPLHPDGTRQTGAEIAQPGEYKYTITVYDANGNPAATAANTFTVAAPPQDGPTPPFGPPCPKPTQ